MPKRNRIADALHSIETGVRIANKVRTMFTSTGGNGGATTNQRRAGAVEQNRFNVPPPRQLTTHQQARAAYTMVKDLMPRMKYVDYVMYNHIQVQNGSNALKHTRRWTGAGTDNTATALHDRSGNGSGGTKTADQFSFLKDVIPSGFSLLVKNADNNRALIKSCIFPLSHIALIQKGDDFDQRLGDFVELSGMHITGRIECNIFHPVVAATQAPYVKAVRLDGALQSPSSGHLDPQRKVRFMLVEVFDSLETAPTDFDDDTYYASTDWVESKDGTDVTKLRIVGAPRLENILALDGQAAILTSVDDMRDGRWTGIDRKYRSNHLKENVWIEPTDGRRVDFKVLKDVSFTLKPRVIPITTGNSTGESYQTSQNSYVNIDMFVRLDADLSYKSYPAESSFGVPTDLTILADNASRHFFWYMFDDHMDNLVVGGVDDPEVSTTAATFMTEVTTSDGYAMTQAKLKCRIFFNDDL